MEINMKEVGCHVMIDDLIEAVRGDIIKLKLAEKELELIRYSNYNYSKKNLKIKFLELYNIVNGIIIVNKLHRYIG